MGVYLDFKNYSREAIINQPQRIKTNIKGQPFIFEISLNRTSDQLLFGVLNSRTFEYLTLLPVTALVDLATGLIAPKFPPGVIIIGQWLTESNLSIADAFMKDFRIYVEEVE